MSNCGKWAASLHKKCKRALIKQRRGTCDHIGISGLPKSDVIELDDYKGMYNNYISNMKKIVYSKIVRLFN